jgi:ABC-type uncharacterized transport system involved in gliding motility auxiliary subunit
MKLSSLIFCGVAIFMGAFSGFVYFVAPEKNIWIYGAGGLSLISALYFILSERGTICTAIKSRSGIHGANAVVLSAIVLAILVFLNLFVYKHKYRFDVTEGGVYTLAAQTKKVVSTLPREVRVTAFFQADSPQEIPFRILADGYAEMSDKIKINYVDPDKNPAITKQYGITTYGSVALESGKQETKVQNPTEENLTNAIIKVIRDEQKTFYFLTGHGEKGINDTEVQGYSAMSEKLKKEGYILKELMLLQTGQIPEDADLLIVAGPVKPILPEEGKLIEAYLNQGGTGFFLLDPQVETGLEDFLRSWGVELENDVVLDPYSKLYGGDAAAPVVNQYVPHEITRDFGLATIFPVLRSVISVPAEGFLSEEILLTSENSWAEFNIDERPVRFDPAQDKKGPIPVAVVSSKAHSHDEVSSNPENNEIHAKHGKIVVVGDSDFAGNNYLNFSGNGDFFLNSASYLAEEENLISIRPRARKNNPLQLTSAQGGVLFILCVIFFPACVALAGVGSWWRRRRL